MAGLSVYRNIDCLITNKGFLRTKGIRPSEKDLGIIPKAAVVFSKRTGVIWVGKDSSLPKKI